MDKGITTILVTSFHIVILSMLLQNIGLTVGDRSLYGQPCNKTVKCDSRAWLGCFEGSCDCLKQDEMLYDDTLHSCVSRAGERCKYAIESSAVVASSSDDPSISQHFKVNGHGHSHSLHHSLSGSDNGLSNGNNGYKNGEAYGNGNGNGNGNNGNNNGSALIFEVTNCVPNAICNTDGICVCDSKYHENLNGTCTLSQNHLEPCDSYNLKCSLYQGLQCSQDNLCRCNESISEYSPHHQQCVGLSGHSCINAKCTDYSTCYTASRAYEDDNNDENLLKVKTNTCSCTTDYFRSDDDRCVAKIGPLGNCTRDDQCQRKPGMELICTNGQCNCNPKISQYASAQKAERYRYDPDIFNGFLGQFYTQCVGLAGTKCLDRLCVPRAFCSYSFINDFSGTCKCLTGYHASKDGTCGHGFSESCDGPDSCLDGLVCNDKKCTCQYSNQDYDPTTKVCYSKIGGPCDNDKKINGSENDNGNDTITVPCGSHARCEMGHCICDEGYVDNANGDCEIGFGGRCEVSSECDTVASLQCINNVCQCGQFAEYSKELRKCRGLVGARCDVMLENECVDLAMCSERHPKLPGICTCDPRASKGETGNYHCI